MSAHLQREAVSFTLRLHGECSFPIKSPDDFARALGYNVERITKSVFLSAKSGEHVIAVCSINKKMRFNLIADALRYGRLQIASKDELGSLLGYPTNGVSPFGVSCPVCVDSAVKDFQTILVGGGAVGAEIEVAPQALIEATAAKVFSFAAAA